MGILNAKKVSSSSATSVCAHLRTAYHNCFNKWYSEKFLKGHWDKEGCVPEWEKYRECLSILIAKGRHYVQKFFNIWMISICVDSWKLNSGDPLAFLSGFHPDNLEKSRTWRSPSKLIPRLNLYLNPNDETRIELFSIMNCFLRVEFTGDGSLLIVEYDHR